MREEGGAHPRRFQAAARERMPRVYSPVEAIMLAADSTTWISMRPTSDGADAIVLDPRGNLRASVPLPARSRIQHATRTHLWVTEVDDFDLTSAVRYRIDRPPSAAAEGGSGDPRDAQSTRSGVMGGCKGRGT